MGPSLKKISTLFAVRVETLLRREAKMNVTAASPGGVPSHHNPLYTGRLFHCYMLDQSICHFRYVGSILSLLFYFYAPNFGEVEGAYWFGPVSPSVHNTLAAEKLKNLLC